MEMDIKTEQLTKPVTKLGVFSWTLYNWAHNAFATLIITFIFSNYFIQSIVHNTIKGTAYWGWAMGISGVVVAILSPFFGSVNDYTGARKPWLGFFTLICIFCSAILWFCKPNDSWLWYALIVAGIASVGYEMAQMFYNSMMVSITPEKRMGRISGWGWALGYIGGLVCLAVGLFVFIKAPWMPKVDAINVRATTLLVAVWYFVFGLPIFFFTADLKRTETPLLLACKQGILELKHTFHKARQYKGIFIYLIAHLFYLDGLNTLFLLGGVYAAGSFHMDFTQLLIFAILLNITSALGAFVLAFVDDWLGSRFTICLSVLAVIIVGSILLVIYSDLLFWIMAAILGFFVGPVQAASRSYMARIAPEHLVTQMFGLYQISGRITAFVGPILVGTFTDIFKSQRIGMIVIPVLMLIGLILMFFCPKVGGSNT